MLEIKKRQQENKRIKVQALIEKKKQLIPYNPLVTRESIDTKQKEIQSYKNKISQEKYFNSGSSPLKTSSNFNKDRSPQTNKTSHN
jgi:hypothetical protein